MANDFSTDASVKALWRFETGALLTDSQGGNPDLTNVNTVTADPSVKPEGVSSAKFVRASTQCLRIDDASLVSGFPMKSGDTLKKGTICGWFQATSLDASALFFAKGSAATNNRSLLAIITAAGVFEIQWGYAGGYEAFDTITLTAGRLYHYAIAFDGVNKILRVIIYDSVTQVVSRYGFSPVNAMYIGSAPLIIGGNWNGSSYLNTLNGYQDEFVVFDRVLNPVEIANIQAGAYTGPFTFNDAVNNADLSFTLGNAGGTSDWSADNDEAHDGVASVHSGQPFPQNATAWFTTTVNGPGTLSFQWGIDAGGSLKFYIDDVLQHSITGADPTPIAWEQKEYFVGVGSHTLKWLKDRLAGYDGRETAWVDEVAWTPNPITAVNGTVFALAAVEKGVAWTPEQVAAIVAGLTE